MSDIKILRMVSGEDVMAEVKDLGTSSFELTNSVVLIPDQNNQIQFIPYAPFGSSPRATAAPNTLSRSPSPARSRAC